MVMTKIYVVTDGMYSDMRVEGATTSLVDAAKIVADKSCDDGPLIQAFEGGHAIEGEGTLYYMTCKLRNGKISPAREGSICYVTEGANVSPIVRVFPNAHWSPVVFVIGSDRSKVAQAFSDTLAAEAIKRGWAIG